MILEALDFNELGEIFAQVFVLKILSCFLSKRQIAPFFYKRAGFARKRFQIS